MALGSGLSVAACSPEPGASGLGGIGRAAGAVPRGLGAGAAGLQVAVIVPGLFL